MDILYHYMHIFWYSSGSCTDSSFPYIQACIHVTGLQQEFCDFFGHHVNHYLDEDDVDVFGGM